MLTTTTTGSADGKSFATRAKRRDSKGSRLFRHAVSAVLRSE